MGKYRFEAIDDSENCTELQLFVGDRTTYTASCS